MSRVSGKKTAFQGRAKQILIRLADNGSLSTSDLVDMLGMTRPNTCTYLARLVDEAFVKTEQGVSDKRFRYHTLTAKGREYMDSWESEQPGGRESFLGSGGYEKSSPVEGESEDDSVGDLLDECEKIVYDGEVTDPYDPEFRE